MTVDRNRRLEVAVRITTKVVTGLLLLLLAWKFEIVFADAARWPGLGFDFGVHQAVARQWVATGMLYVPVQLSGPYPVDPAYTPGGVLNLYPPPMALLFVAFLVLPAVLWWAIPIGIVAAMAIYWRPRPWAWPLVVAALLLLGFPISVAMGNSILWAMAAVALATRWPGAALGLAGKPVVFPIALLFVRRSRSWLIVGALAAALAIAFLPWWPAYITSARNAAAAVGLAGTLFYYYPAPLLALVPMIPWLARSRLRPMTPR